MKKIITKLYFVFRVFWELPQNILGVFYIIKYKKMIKNIRFYFKQIVIHLNSENKIPKEFMEEGEMSCGLFIFDTGIYNKKLNKHYEYGNIPLIRDEFGKLLINFDILSKILGPFYFLIYIPFKFQFSIFLKKLTKLEKINFNENSEFLRKIRIITKNFIDSFIVIFVLNLGHYSKEKIKDALYNRIVYNNLVDIVKMVNNRQVDY